MKKLIIVLMAICFMQVSYAQKTIKKKEYYDYYETQLKRTWSELGDGTYHGVENGYDKGGNKIYTANWDRGICLKVQVFYQDGSLALLRQKNKNDNFNGKQEYYLFKEGQRFLKSSANAIDGEIIEFKTYFVDDNLKPYLNWVYRKEGDKKIYEEYEDREIKIQLITENGKLSGNIEDYDFKAKMDSNHVISFEDDSYKAETVNGKLFYRGKSNYNEFFKTKVKNFGVEFNPELRITHPMYGISFELLLELSKIGVHNGYVCNNTRRSGYNIYHGKMKDLIEIPGYLLKQYVFDSLYIDRNGPNDVKSETMYDKGTQVCKKEYENGKLKLFNDYENGILSEYNKQGQRIRETHGDTIREYNEQGQLIKETIGEKFKVFDSQGKVIDSNEIREQYNSIVDKYNAVKNKYSDLNKLTNDIIKNDFCIDIGTGQFINQETCFDRHNRYIGEAFRILHLDYIKAWKELETKLEAKLETKEIYKTLNWNSDNHLIEKTEVMKEYSDFFENNLELIAQFTLTIDKFKELLNSPDVKKINRSLKKATTSSEIKSIIGL